MKPQRSATGALTVSAAVFLASNLLHGADHLRQGLSTVDSGTRAGGAAITLAAFTVLALAARRHPAAAPAAAVVGFATAALVTASHVLPHWSALSSSYVDDLAVDALSWAAVLLEIACALVMGCVAASALRTSDPQEVVRHG